MSFPASTPTTYPQDSIAAVRNPQSRRSGALRIPQAGAIALAAPLLVYVASLWFLYPLPLPYLTLFLLLLAPLAIRVPRTQVLESLFRVRVELFLLGVMIVLSVFSLSNSDAPFRSFRIIFPSAVPFFLVAHFAIVRSVALPWLLWVPRALIVAGFLFSVCPFLLTVALPPLKPLFYDDYRLKSFFEISIQNSIALSVLMPLMVAEVVLQKGRWQKAVLGFLLLILAYTLFRAGAKTAIGVGYLGGLFTFLVLKVRDQGLFRNLAMAGAVVAAGVFLSMFGIQIAEKIEPEIAGKLKSIVEGGVTSYQSVQARRNLWEVAIQEGSRHWLVGSGAGEPILRYPHAHNLVLDYFKGIGMFGALAVITLCLIIVGRTLHKAGVILFGRPSASDKRILACYVAASIYVLCNQMSDCFGPSTIGILWTVYLAGVLSEQHRWRKAPRAGAVA